MNSCLIEFVVLILVSVLQQSNCDDILGCGGFVKSDVEINFSLVEVKLYTSSGSLKYQVDCAPNNGYYMIPVYDKGDYMLQVDPPKGWNFEPSSVQLHIDGKTDPCSRGEDINFLFIGFSVEGVVSSRGASGEGPMGVSVKLTDTRGRLPTVEATTTEGGVYRFDRVLPGTYKITASHPVWKFDKDTISVTVDKSNVKGANGMVIHGYDVSGRVTSDGDPVSGVHILLFSDKTKPSDLLGCDTKPPPGYTGQQRILCTVQSDKDGVFKLHSLPNGAYSVVPFYKAEKIMFDVEPARLEFNVIHDSLVLQQEFRVAGFSVTGRVVNKVKGSGVVDAEVLLNDRPTTRTKSDGSYVLDNMKTGTYVITVRCQDMGFEPTTVTVSPNTPSLPDITPSSFSLCGAIVIDKLPRSMTVTSKIRQVTISSEKGEFSLRTDEEGKFCAQVEPGTYILKPVLTDTEVSSGLRLSRDQLSVTVTSQPVHGLTFSQFKATASGKVTCIGKCLSVLHISLVAAGSSGDHRTVQLDAPENQAPFSFSDLMPGRYQVQLVEEQRCWNEKSIKFELVDKDVTSLDFVQSGFVLAYTSSHDIDLEYQVAGKKRVFSARKGSGSHCVEEAGTYTLVPKSCHKFDRETYLFDTWSPSPVTINAIKHQLNVIIKSTDNVTDLDIQISSSRPEVTPQTYRVAAVKDKNSDAGKPTYIYSIVHWADSGEEVSVKPAAKRLLFYPSSKMAMVQGDTCPGTSVEFEGRAGVFISGHVTPPLRGVTVTIYGDGEDSVPIEVKTDDKGQYSVGPLRDGIGYTVAAVKEGFVLTPIEKQPYSFNAFKLGQISVKVTEADDVTLSGVLLSLSGGDRYRSNKLTAEDGSMDFLGLSPGQYFMRPMMKEYQFEPSTKMIDVREGSTVTVKISGTRVAYSCYGAVTSLNGEAEPELLVEAVGRGACKEYQEESKTENDGTFRIRGLRPPCEYEIRLKTDEANEHIDRTAPSSFVIQMTGGDVDKVNIIAFRRMNVMDLSGRLVTDQEYLNTVTVSIYREMNPDYPVADVRLSVSNMFYLPSLPVDNKNYVIRVKTTLSRSLYDYTLPEITFKANSSYKHFQLQFKPERRNADQELNPGSFLTVPLTLLVLFLSYHFDQVKPMLASLMGAVSGERMPAPSSPARSPSRSPSPVDTAFTAPTTAPDTGVKKKPKVRRT